MENKPIPLKELFSEKGVKLEQEILDAQTTSQRINIAETFLLELLKSKEVKDRIISSTIEIISKHKGQLTVNELSKQVNSNRRMLARKFSSDVGLSPKQLSKIVRLQNSLKSLLQKEKTSLTNLAYENEYFDQAHFIKDFKEFTGITPKEFYGEDLKMSLIFDSKK
nr:helix-turn-helix transcriptional regulator [Aureivirga marina]